MDIFKKPVFILRTFFIAGALFFMVLPATFVFAKGSSKVEQKGAKVPPKNQKPKSVSVRAQSEQEKKEHTRKLEKRKERKRLLNKKEGNSGQKSRPKQQRQNTSGGGK